VNRFGSVIMRRIVWTSMLMLTVSETLVLHWLLLVSGRPGLGWMQAVLCAVLVAAANFAIASLLRRRSRTIRPVWVMSRLFMVGSLGALVSGPLLILVFVSGGLALGLTRVFGGPDRVADVMFVAGGTVAVAIGFGSMLWGYLVGQRRVRVDRVDLPLRNLPVPLEGVRIAHISDLHIGQQLRAPRLRGLIERVNELEADLIVITGDIFDFDPSFIEEGCRELSRLRARHGVFAVLGNHDVYTGTEAVASALDRLTSIRLLRGEYVQVRIDGAPLYLLGFDDPGQSLSERDSESQTLVRLVQEVPKDGPSILLVHRPSFFRQAAALGLPVSLAGHTHGGQISLPPPAHHHNVARLITRWTRGLFEDGDSLLYVNRGLGVAGPPIRINCPREIALLRLVPRR